ncbi:unnamed protein product [Amoebophrya sp. A120]|nr:unnamed protein product [Amoebophrya sp. A120]|eukprot:GSA120T00003118001.1
MLEDELHPTRERFYMGAYTAALATGEKAATRNDIAESEKKGIMGRCYLALGKFSQLKDLRNSPEASQRCCALFAMFTKAKEQAHKDKAFGDLVELAKSSRDQTATYLAACAYALQGDALEAVNLVQASGFTTPEMQGLLAQLFLAMYRVDLATKQMRQVNQVSDDHVIAKMVSALVNLANGNYQEAFLLYCDVEAQYGDEVATIPSSAICNGKACANLQRGNFSEAPEELSKMQEVAPGDQDTLVNLCATSIHLGNEEEAKKHIETLRKVNPEHALIKKLDHLHNSVANYVP